MDVPRGVLHSPPSTASAPLLSIVINNLLLNQAAFLLHLESFPLVLLPAPVSAQQATSSHQGHLQRAFLAAPPHSWAADKALL